MSQLRVAAVDLGATSGRVMAARVAPDELSLQEVHRFPNGGVPVAGSLFWDVLGIHREVLAGVAAAAAAVMLVGDDDSLSAGTAATNASPLSGPEVRFSGADVTTGAVVGATQLRRSAHVDVGVEPTMTLSADPVRLKRILGNLVDNAIVHGGGTVRVRARAHGDRILVDVTDDGPGIGFDELDKIFDRFHKSDRSRATGGSGLGLAIARQYARSHGGSITVHNEPGHGACFTLTLPAQPSPE